MRLFGFLFSISFPFLLATAFISVDQCEVVEPDGSDLTTTPMVIAPVMEHHFLDKNKVNFFYHVGPWSTHNTKENLITAQSIKDILPRERTERIIEYKSIALVTVKNGKRSDVKLYSSTEKFTDKQKELLANTNLFSKYIFEINCIEKEPETGKLFTEQFNPHYCVAPYKQATFKYGQDSLMNYFEDRGKPATQNLDKFKLGSAKIYFVVTEFGEVTNLLQDRSCGYENLDQLMMELIKNTSKAWIPATTQTGQNVKQELVFTYGQGC